MDQEVNQFVQKLALSRVQQYQKEGSGIFTKVYNDKGKQVDVADQFKYLLSYYQVLPQDLPELNTYILGYPNAKPANVENSFYWEKMNFGLKPTLRSVHVLTMHGDKPNQPLYVIAEKQLYSSHYFETALDLTFLFRGSDDPKQPGFYLVKTMGCEQAFLSGFKGAMTRRIAVSHAVSDMEKAWLPLRKSSSIRNSRAVVACGQTAASIPPPALFPMQVDHLEHPPQPEIPIVMPAIAVAGSNGQRTEQSIEYQCRCSIVR